MAAKENYSAKNSSPQRSYKICAGIVLLSTQTVSKVSPPRRTDTPVIFNVICSKRRLRSCHRPHQSAALGGMSSALPQNFSETWPHGGTEVSCIYWAGHRVFLYSLWRNVASELRRSAVVFRGSGLALTSRIWHTSASLAIIRSIKSSLRAHHSGRSFHHAQIPILTP